MSQQPMISARRPGVSPIWDQSAGRGVRSRMVLCLGQWPRAAVLERYFQERGWKVHMADSPEAARTLVCKHGPSLVILADESNADESGWLTSWKLLRDQPGSRVVLVGDLPLERGKRLAKFVGASAYLPSSETAMGLAHMLTDMKICR